jgi:hypothetical protein
VPHETTPERLRLDKLLCRAEKVAVIAGIVNLDATLLAKLAG